MFAGTARGDGIAGLMVSKSIPEATVAVIDPESGTSSGGGTGTDVRLAPGDVILFRINYFAMPDRVMRGVQGYLTEFIPPNTEVVGVRLIDSQGRTVLPNPPGLAIDGCGGGSRCTSYTSVPCTGGTGCSGGTRSIASGSVAQLYADTGIFYSTDARTERRPNTQFISYVNGFRMWEEPISVPNIAPILGITAPYFGHTQWDLDQLGAYGISNTAGNASGNGGDGDVPFGYGSAVAGPQTFYHYEASDVVADPTLAMWNTANPNDENGLKLNDVIGPWQRIRYPGSLTGTGTASFSGAMTRRTADASSSGFDVRPANPIPSAANALRVALGELRAGEAGTLEVALRVLDTPIDPVQGRDLDCAEIFGGGTSAESPSGSGNGGVDQPWGFVVPSPACVYLNNQFDLTVDRALATGGQTLTYTLHGRNLSTLPQTNVVVTQDYDSSRVSFVSATGAPMSTTCNGRACLSWNLGTLDPGEEYTFTTRFSVGGTGQISAVSYANYRSTQLPSPGFTTQAVTLVRATPLLRATLAPASPSAFITVPGNLALTGQLRNDGTNLATIEDVAIVLPSTTWALSPASITVNGTAYAATQIAGTSVWRAALNGGGLNLAAGAAFSLGVTVRANSGTATPTLYDVGIQTWANSTGYGGSFETFFPRLAKVPVGQARSVPPVLDCPILSNQTRIDGATSEADGTDVRVYFNLTERGVDTNATGGRFDAGTFGSGSTFGALYGGLEVRATAQAPGELESDFSAPCFITHVPQCADGLDNDGDGDIDFPTDPGCASAEDGDERDPQCADGLDNDGDGNVDFPLDPECTGPDDNTEGGAAACSNGVDDDGDGRVDYPADPDCTSANDRDEATRRACSDGVDNDGDGRTDFGTAASNDPGCHSANDTSEASFAYAPGDVRPRILLVFDTSGSMNWNVCADEWTGGDGSVECAGGDVACAQCGASGCGNAAADDSRIDRARAGVRDVVAGFGDVELGLMRFRQRATSFACPTVNATGASGGWAGAGATCGSFAAGDLLVGFSPENEYSMLEWLDGSDNYGGTAPPGLDLELRGSGTTPLAGSLASAESYLEDARGADAQSSCRPYRVILLTDGAETCGGDPVSAATSLRTSGFPVNVIGFANSPSASTQLNSIASAGGTTSAIFVDDSATLSAAIADIVNDSILTEVCNRADDDCDTLVDEGFVLYCDRPGGVATLSLCADPGERQCDGVDDNCDGRIDEGLRNRCGACGAEPPEVCNGVDDDCDGVADEGNVCAGCRPEAEICDNIDNDCDSRVDETLTRGCGTDVGECSVGTETCAAGSWGACVGGVGPRTETCNNRDDDCDGVIDGITQSCGSNVGTCRTGVQTCTAGSFGSCVGAVGPGSELCNTLDDDCDTRTDEGNPGGGASCGTALGRCTQGSLACTGGQLVCTGGTGPTTELCNAADDDCDGRTDESVPPGAVCGACGGGLMRCVSGTMTCTGDRAPGTEVCNGADDDCDTRTDEGNPGGGVDCGSDTGACDSGTTRCTGGLIVCEGDIAPATETCNNVDDDCDNLVDEGNPGGGAACGGSDAGECERGSQVCVMGALVCVGESGPLPERCDGLDNDCDTRVDEGNPGGGAACGDDTGECRAGTTTCIDGELECTGAIGPVAELCNTLDDDCDGVVDDGLSLGAPCGTDQGECVPGVLLCRDGETVCDGAIGPADESCNALDDDCDGAVDEALPLGGECGETEGACVPGMLQCVRGREVCVGEMPRGRETCDCEDDDCDGAVDEAPETGELCPPGSECLDCSCALRCVDDEFARCPSGRVPQYRDDGSCFCVAPRCDSTTCAGETVMQGDDVLCGPGGGDVPSCVCRNNACTYPCDGVTCTEPTVCHPQLGRCVTDDCLGLGCPEGQICDATRLECVEDPCFVAGCTEQQACRAGECETSCADVSCGPNEKCERGTCVTDRCLDRECLDDQTCDPATGNCVADECGGIVCPAGSICDPLTGDCERDECLDLRCPERQFCRGGECVRIDTGPDAGMHPDGGVGVADGGVEGFDAGRDPTVRVLAAGGGMMCAAGAPGAGGVGGTWALLALLGAALIARRRAR